MVDYPARGTIFDLLELHGISWVNYNNLPPARIGWRRLSHAHGLAYLRMLGAVLAGLVPGLADSMLSKLQVTADLYPLGLLRSLRHLGRQLWSADTGPATYEQLGFRAASHDGRPTPGRTS